MKILLVEDDLNIIEIIATELAGGQVDLTIARSRDAGIGALAGETYDLIVCDLKLPPQDGALDIEIEHGLSMYSAAADRCPGVPILFFSAFATVDFLTELLRNAQKKDIFGSGQPYQLIDHVKKGNLTDCLRRIGAFTDELNRLQTIEIATGIKPVQLDNVEKRILRIFSRRLGGTIVEVSELSGGLSDAHTLRVLVKDGNGTVISRAVAKINLLRHVSEEHVQFRKHVSPILPIGSYTDYTDIVDCGTGQKGALFYKLADGFDRSLFKMIADEPASAATCIAQLRNASAKWCTGYPTITTKVSAIRQLFVGDKDFERLGEFLEQIDWRNVESRDVQARICPQHGDLHGANVLVRTFEHVVMIDFGSVGRFPACLDPIALELSLLFHPEGHEIVKDWPSAANAEHWNDLDKYLEKCPQAAYVRACREWAVQLSAGSRELYATVYGFCIKQLGYKDTDKDLALRIIQCAIDAFNAT